MSAPTAACPAPCQGGSGDLLVHTKSHRARRRAGRSFGAQITRIPLDELTQAELEAINADPELVVTFSAQAQQRQDPRSRRG